MKKFEKEIKLFQTIFLENCDVVTKLKQEKNVYHRFEYYGLATAKRKPLIRTYLSQWNKKYNVQEKHELFEALYRQPQREFKYSALDFLDKWWKKELNFKDLDWLLALIRLDIWWETVDIVDHIFGTILNQLPDRKQEYSYLMFLLNDSDDWVKRIAIQSQLMLHAKANIDLVLEMVTGYLDTKNFYLIRSVGWALRNAKRVDDSKVSAYLIHHNVNNKIMQVIKEH